VFDFAGFQAHHWLSAVALTVSGYTTGVIAAFSIRLPRMRASNVLSAGIERDAFL